MMLFPRVVFVAGKKLAGKDTVCDRIVAEVPGFTKIHIATPWLKKHCEDMGIEYEREYLPNKAKYRAEIQRRAVRARTENPNCLVDMLPGVIDPLLAAGQHVAVSGIRFYNEALFAIERGYFVVQVTCPEEIRHERFRAVGEDLSRLNDPFEAELETLPCHLVIGGVWNPAYAVATIRRSYQYLLERQTEMQHAA